MKWKLKTLILLNIWVCYDLIALTQDTILTYFYRVEDDTARDVFMQYMLLRIRIIQHSTVELVREPGFRSRRPFKISMFWQWP